MLLQRFGRGLHQVNETNRSSDEGLGQKVARALNFRSIFLYK